MQNFRYISTVERIFKNQLFDRQKKAIIVSKVLRILSIFKNSGIFLTFLTYVKSFGSFSFGFDVLFSKDFLPLKVPKVWNTGKVERPKIFDKRIALVASIVWNINANKITENQI